MTSGTYDIGSGLDYASAQAMEADITGVMTGDITGNFADEQTICDGDYVVNPETAGYTLTFQGKAGETHSGIFGNATHTAGDGARIFWNTDNDSFTIDEGTDATLDDMVWRDLVLDITPAKSDAFRMTDGGEGEIIFERLVVKGSSSTDTGWTCQQGCRNITTRNCIVYDIGQSTTVDAFYSIDSLNQAYNNHLLQNNTIINCELGVRQGHGSPNGSAVVHLENNLFQASGTASITEASAVITSNGYNITEDGNGPDAAYDNTDVHTNSVFTDYANDDFTLDSGGDATNLAIVDDGEDLSSDFTDDVVQNTRSTWYIGASEIPTAAVGGVLKRPLDNYTRNLITR